MHGATTLQLPWKTPDGKPRAAKLLFTREDGRAHNRNQFNDYVWHPALKAVGVPLGRENGMHALRHYFAGVLLDGGVSIREVAEWLGHSDPGFTLRTYTHLMKRGEERMRLAVDQALRGASADGQSKPSAPVVRSGVV